MGDSILGATSRRRRRTRCSVRKKEARVFRPSAIVIKEEVLPGPGIWRAVCMSGWLIGMTISTMRKHRPRTLAGRPKARRKCSAAGPIRIIPTGFEHPSARKIIRLKHAPTSGFAAHKTFQSCRNIFPTGFVTLVTLTHGIPWGALSKNQRLFRTEPLPTESNLHDDHFQSDRVPSTNR
jgi:hypothetical protein